MGLSALAPAPPPTVPVVVADQPLAVGDALGEHNLTVRRMPADALPDGTFASAEPLAGHRAVGAVSPGEVLTPARVRPDALLEGLEGDLVAAFVPVPEPALLGILGPGTRIDVLRTSDGSVVAEDALVVSAARAPESSWAGTPAGAGGGVLVAVSAEEAGRLALASGTGLPGASLAVVVRPAR